MLEHEAAHLVVAHAVGAEISHAELDPTAVGVNTSVGRVKWQLRDNDVDGFIAIYIAGPAQTYITVARTGQATSIADFTLDAEAQDLANSDWFVGETLSVEVAKRLMVANLSTIQEYLRLPEIQAAIGAIADALQVAGAATKMRVGWSELRPLVEGVVLLRPPKMHLVL